MDTTFISILTNVNTDTNGEFWLCILSEYMCSNKNYQKKKESLLHIVSSSISNHFTKLCTFLFSVGICL